MFMNCDCSQNNVWAFVCYWFVIVCPGFLLPCCWFFCRMPWLKPLWRSWPHCTAPSILMAQEPPRSVSLSFGCGTLQGEPVPKKSIMALRAFSFWSFKAYDFASGWIFYEICHQFLFRKRAKYNAFNTHKHSLSINTYWASLVNAFWK